MDYLKRRLAEPSTHAGLALLVLSLGRLLFPQYAAVIDALGAVFGGTAMALPERGHAAPTP